MPTEPRFVELAGVQEGSLVVNAAAAVFEVATLPGRSPLEAIVEFLAPRRALLVLDNCEHLLAASAALCDELLRAAPAADDPRDHPRAAARRRRGRVPRALAGDPRPRA